MLKRVHHKQFTLFLKLSESELLNRILGYGREKQVLPLTRTDLEEICILNHRPTLQKIIKKLPTDLFAERQSSALCNKWIQLEQMGSDNHPQYFTHASEYYNILQQHQYVQYEYRVQEDPRVWLPLRHSEGLWGKQREWLQEQYVQNLKHRIKGNGRALACVDSLFPPELFNLTDSPMVLPYLPGLLARVRPDSAVGIESTLLWMKRWNVDMQACMAGWLSQIATLSTIPSNFISCAHSLYLLPLTPSTPPIVEPLFTALFKSQQHFIEGMSNISSQYQSHIKKIASQYNQLSQWSNFHDHPSINHKKEAQQMVLLKLVRFLLLCCQVGVQKVDAVFRYEKIETFLKEYYYVGDLCGEIIYYADVYESKYQKKLLGAEMEVVIREYGKVLQREWKRMCEGESQPFYGNRYNMVDSVLGQQGYDSTYLSKIPKNPTCSLLNDSEVVGQLIDNPFRQGMLQKLQQSSLLSSAAKCSYPYFTDFTVSNHNYLLKTPFFRAKRPPPNTTIEQVHQLKHGCKKLKQIINKL